MCTLVGCAAGSPMDLAATGSVGTGQSEWGQKLGWLFQQRTRFKARFFSDPSDSLSNPLRPAIDRSSLQVDERSDCGVARTKDETTRSAAIATKLPVKFNT
jgi:hypothetical protein